MNPVDAIVWEVLKLFLPILIVFVLVGLVRHWLRKRGRAHGA
jgi:hypothetical protein